MDKVLQDARYLWKLCFPTDTEDFMDFYFARVARAEDTYIYYDAEGKPLAHIGLLRYGYKDRGAEALAYISGACTHPEAQRQGLMGLLMRQVIETERARGTEALILIPASEELRGYYHRHFAFVDAAPRWTISWALYVEARLSARYVSIASPTAAGLLSHYYRGTSHITYTEQQAGAVIAEYRHSTGALVLESACGGCSAGLLLARLEDGRSVIDCLIGKPSVQDELVHELQERYPGNEILVANLFADDIQLELLEGKVGYASEPWAMVLPLQSSSGNEGYRSLAVALVHN